MYPKSLQKYSTEEEIIGTWINGKPIYQKVFVVSTPAEINTDTAVLDIPSHTETHIEMYAQVYADNIGVIVPVPYYFHSGNYGMIWRDLNTKKIMMLLNLNAYCNRELMIILKYTKSTD